jgi:hypothetical protein
MRGSIFVASKYAAIGDFGGGHIEVESSATQSFATGWRRNAVDYSRCYQGSQEMGSRLSEPTVAYRGEHNGR